MRAGAVNLMRFARRSTNRDIKLNSFGPVAYTAQENQVISRHAQVVMAAGADLLCTWLQGIAANAGEVTEG